MRHFRLLIILLLVEIVGAQDSLNCRLLSTTGDLVDSYALVITDNIAFTAKSSQFYILDLSDIYNPILIYGDSIDAESTVNEISSIAVVNDLAYLTCRNGLVILDISSYESPVVLSQLITEEYLDNITIDDNFAYVGTADYSFLVFDVSDPENPAEIGRVDENIDDVWDLEIWNDLLLAASEDTGGKIFNIYEPSNPIEISSMQVHTAVDIEARDNVAFITRPRDLYTFDITDLENPKQLDYLENAGGESIFIEGDYAYCLNIDNKMMVVDISEPSDMKIVGYYPLPRIGSDIYVKDKIVYTTCQIYGIYIIQFDETVHIRDTKTTIAEFSLSQNYPNPFNPSTMIEYHIPLRSYVNVSIYNLNGQLIDVLISEEVNPGSYKIKWNGGNHSSGVYFYKLSTKDYNYTKKCILLK
jgi:hypothetical protein